VKSMARRISLTSLSFLLIGSFLMPSGLLLNGAIYDTVAYSVDDGLLGIEAEAIPMVEDMLADFAIPTALRGIRDEGIPAVEEIIKQIGVQMALDGIGGEAQPLIEEMVKQLGIAEVMSQVRDAAIPTVVEMVKQLGVPEVLFQIRDAANPVVVEMVKQLGCAEVLTQIREMAIPLIEEMVNATFMAFILSFIFDGMEMDMFMELDGLDLKVHITAAAADPEDFFNGPSYQFDVNAQVYLWFISDWLYLMTLDVMEFDGVSRFIGQGNLSYSALAQDRILNGNDTDNSGSPYYIPGFLQDTESGSGVSDFLALYDEATSDMGLRSEMQTNYDCTWNQLSNITEYLLMYLETELIPMLIEGIVIDAGIFGTFPVDTLATFMPQLAGMQSTDEIAESIFYELWTNGTALGSVIYEGGIDFGELVDGIPEGTTGFELGVPIPSNFSIETVMKLWNISNEDSLVNMDGIDVWFRANESFSIEGYNDPYRHLQGAFNLEEPEMDMILNWLWNGSECLSQNLVPKLLESDYGYGVPIEVFAEYLLMEQWANGTIFGEVMYDEGIDFSDMIDGLASGTTGFEVGVPVPANITLNKMLELWDENNESTFLNMDGIELWLEANSSATVKDDLTNMFGLTETQMTMILEWMWLGEDCFSQKIVPILLESDYGYGIPIDEFAVQLLIEQWANGTIFGEVMYEGGIDFSEMVEGLPENTTGFEVGVPIPLNLSLDIALALWDEDNESAILNMGGMQLWFEANSSIFTKGGLMSLFGLTEIQMDMILEWMWYGNDSFSERLVPLLLESDYGYGMPLSDFAEILLMEQWANGTIMGMVMYERGLDFHEFFPELPEDATGFEVGIPKPTNLTADVALALWNGTDDDAILSEDGINRWIDAWDDEEVAEELRTNFSLTEAQMDMILEWLWDGDDCFSQKLVPILVELPAPTGYGMPIADFAEVLFYEQWADGTILGEKMYPEGIDFSEMLEEIKEPLFGFEVGVPDPSHIPFETAKSLFTDENPKALTNDDGINHWIAAYTDDTYKDDLILNFSLAEYQMDMLLDWLFNRSFRDDVVPFLIEVAPPAGMGMTMTEFAKVILLEVWTNGTAYGRALYPYGFPLPLGDVEVFGLEVGYQDPETPVIASGISLSSAEILWDPESDVSLTNDLGLEKWYKAVNDPFSDSAAELKETVGLNDEQFFMVIEWLPKFRDNVMPYLAQYEMGLPMDTTALGNMLQFGTTMIGGACLGVSGLTYSRHVVKKRKKAAAYGLKKAPKMKKLNKKTAFTEAKEAPKPKTQSSIKELNGSFPESEEILGDKQSRKSIERKKDEEMEELWRAAKNEDNEGI
jgi:hypothetical protein